MRGKPFRIGRAVSLLVLVTAVGLALGAFWGEPRRLVVRETSINPPAHDLGP